MKPLELKFTRQVAITHAAADIICISAQRASSAGRDILESAHCYLYGALVYDFVVWASAAIGPSIRMPDQSIKPSREFLFEHCFDSILSPIMSRRHGEEFIGKVRVKAKRMLW